MSSKQDSRVSGNTGEGGGGNRGQTGYNNERRQQGWKDTQEGLKDTKGGGEYCSCRTLKLCRKSLDPGGGEPARSHFARVGEK